MGNMPRAVEDFPNQFCWTSAVADSNTFLLFDSIDYYFKINEQKGEFK